MSQAYEDFDLLVDRTESAYRLRVIDSPAGQAQATVALTPELEAIQASIAEGWQVDELDPALVRPWGRVLYATLFRGEVETCLLRSLDAARRSGSGLRIRLHLTDAPELAALPWELAYSPQLERFLALSNSTPIVRYMAVSQGEPRLPVDPPLAMLCVLADPADLAPRLAVESEWHSVQDAVAPLVATGAMTLQRLAAPTVTELRSHLRRNRVNLIHFIGHGWYDAATTQAGLVFEDDAQQASLVSAELLGVLLEGHSALRMVFLNACAGARVAERDAFQGTAQHLVRLGVPLVVAMQFDIVNERATLLAQEFYRAVADGYPAEAAITEARKALFEPGSAPDWGTPVIFTRASDNRLVQKAPPVAERAASPSAPPAPRLSFEPEMAPIPAGPFLMGAADAPMEWRQHTVDLPAFSIGKYPVTNDQYAAFVRQNRAHRPLQSKWFFTTPPADRLDHPVAGITWHDAVAYCAWLSAQTERAYRLPTEAEWEKAARGDDGRTYPWGEEPPAAQRCTNGGGQTTAVTATPDGCSPYGVCDMAGNVREWTSTRWGDDMRRAQFVFPYRRDERDNPSERANELHICRGGAFDDPPTLLTCSARTIVHADARLVTVGFRVVCEA
ncbi:MAG: SUMF1/EgtB/PvdO family nonheme iron enzyme [Caldilinea sp.]